MLSLVRATSTDDPEANARPRVGYQAWGKWPKAIAVCAGQHGSVSQYYDI